MILPSLLLGFVLSCGQLAPQEDTFLGLEPPGPEPILFAPGSVSTRYRERDITFSPDGREFYYTIQGSARSSIVVVRKEDDGWRGPFVASFSSSFNELEAFVTADGKRLYFASNRPLDEDEKEPKDFDIWYVEREGEGWGDPIHAGPVINSEGNEFYPAVANNGNLYITKRLPAGERGGCGGEDICRFVFRDGAYSEIESLGAPINSADDEYNAYVAPDERLIAYGRNGHMFVSFRREDGTFTKPLDLSTAIDPPQSGAMCPSLTPDGRFLFFTGQRAPGFDYPDPSDAVRQVMRGLDNPILQGGGAPRQFQDIYWMDSEILQDLEIEAFDEEG